MIAATMMAASELNTLCLLLSGSLSQQEAVRREAEQKLEQAVTGVGFAPLVLQVALLPEGQVDLGVRQAAAVYFKNLISKRYDPFDESKPTLDAADKSQLREVIVRAVVESTSTVRPHLLAAMHKMARADWPKRWPGLLDELYPLLCSERNTAVLAALQMMTGVLAWHGAVGGETRQALQMRIFPCLLNVLQGRFEATFSSSSELDLTAIAVIKAILKNMHVAIRYGLAMQPAVGDAIFQQWCAAITLIIQLPVPQAIRILSDEEAEVHIFWKMKKWAFHLHNALFLQHVGSRLDSHAGGASDRNTISSTKFYTTQVAVPVLQVYMRQIESYLQGTNPFPARIFCLICDLLEAAIRHKRTWETMKEHTMDIIIHFIFPKLCFNDHDRQLWEEDPEEYARIKVDPEPIDEIYSDQSTAISLLLAITKTRRKVIFLPLLEFLNGILRAADARDMASLRRKDGALCALGALESVLVESPVKDQLESVVVAYVIPDLSNPEGFLRLRACCTIEQLSELTYSEQTCLTILQGVLACLTDSALPVRVAAVGALNALLDNETTQRTLPSCLGRIIEILLGLANQVQLDSIAFLLRRLVEMFADDLVPYATQLCVQLCDTLVRCLEGYSNLADLPEGGVCEEPTDFDEPTSKLMVAIGIIKAIDTLLGAMSKRPELLPALEEALLPLIAMVFERKIVDVYEEIFELIEELTYNSKRISPGLWALLPYVYGVFKESGSYYIQDMHTSLDNYISYGHATLLANEAHMHTMLDIIKTAMTDAAFSVHERIYGCKLMESLMLHCRSQVDPCIPAFIDYVLPVLQDEATSVSVSVYHLQVLINALYYNPTMTLAHLEARQATALFFTRWIAKASKFTRVHDKRLIIVSVCQLLLTIPFVHLPPFLQQNWSFILPVLLDAAQTLPKALEERRKLEEEDEDDDDEDEDEDEEDDDEDEEDDYEEEEAEKDGHQENANYYGINGDGNETGSEQRSVASKMTTTSIIDDSEGREGETKHVDSNSHIDEEDDDEWDELEEELFFQTPLDTIDMTACMRQALMGVAQHDPQSFNLLTQRLLPPQAKFLQSVLDGTLQ